MRVHLVSFAAPLVLLGAIVGCSSKNDNGGPSGAGASGSGSSTSSGQGGGGGAGSTSSSGSTSTGSGASTTGWTAMPLVDDNSDPQNPVSRGGNDRVTGIYYKSLTDGWITTAGSQQTFGNGGAVFKATQTQITKVLFGGNRDGLCLGGTIDFYGLDKSPDGLVALAYACDIIASHDGGQTFTIQSAQSGDAHGIESVLAMRFRASDTLMVAETGYVATTAGVPGPNALWTDTWAPEAVPPTPNPVPADQCQERPHGWQPTTRSPVYVSPDGKFVAYTATPNFDPQVCVSTDGGKSFFPKLLPNIPSDLQDLQPLGVTFASATTGIVHWGDGVHTGLAYIYRTTDSGQTWAKVPLPADVAAKTVELTYAFFAPDGVHGFIVGYDYDDQIALLLRSEDAGATWKRATGDLAAKVSAAGGGKLYSGFALDGNHIWVGGDWGVLMASDTSGQ